MTDQRSTAITWRYEYVPQVNTRAGTLALDALCDDGWEPFAVTTDGAGAITVHVRRQVENGSTEQAR